MIITRKEYETKISTILENVNTLATLRECLRHTDRQLAAFNTKRSKIKDQRTRHELRKEMKFWYFLRKRIYVTSDMWVNDALEDQAFLLLPEYERTSPVRYRYLASFRLHPTELRYIKGFNKLVELGWYNRESNPKGVVKDHRLSIKFGHANKIDPALLAHPANCEFLTVAENAHKSCNSSLTLLELQNNIKRWRI